MTFQALTTFVDLSSLLSKLLSSAIPQVYWVGYDSLVLISAQYIATWSVIVSQNPLTYLFPRRWLDIRGQKVNDYWQAAMRAVISLVVFRPGITQVSNFAPPIRTLTDHVIFRAKSSGGSALCMTGKK